VHRQPGEHADADELPDHQPTTPWVTDDDTARSIDSLLITTPALAKRNRGTITKLVQGARGARATRPPH
jgi:hypothetical protein